MKILVLMPLREDCVYMAEKIYNSMSHEAKDKTFVMPCFMEYLVFTKITPNWDYALFDAIISAKTMYKAAVESDDDIIIIGNMPSEYKFDQVFNMQSAEEELPYNDPAITNLQQLIITNDKLTDEERRPLLDLIGDMHKNEESELALINCVATADFLTAYLQTDPKLDKIKEEYENKKKELEKY